MDGRKGRHEPPPIAATYRTLIGLLAVTGMRIGEAIRLDRDDVDWRRGRAHGPAGKFGKSRELALHPSTVAALRRLCRTAATDTRPWTRTPALFISSAGTRLSYCNVHHRVPPAHPGRRAAATFGDVPSTPA